MKIDVITLHAVQNYGSVLQAFATQKILESFGCEVTIINYAKERVRPENLLKTWSGNNPLKALIMYPTIKRWNRVFGEFCTNYLNLSGKMITTDSDFKEYPLDADAYCTGSDQVWNSIWNRGILTPLYLGFVPEDKFKFAFSSSFGQDRLEADEVRNTVKYIKQYKYISVREESAVSILKEQYKYDNVIHILDPTLLLNSETWRKYVKNKEKSEDYILIYNLNRSKEFDKYAKKLSKITGLKLVRFCTRYDQFYRVGKSELVPDVFEFVRLIDNAKYVLTDSFHATAFSMNLNTEPICIYPQEFGGRLDSFLRLTNSLQRRVNSFEDFDVINRHVDFEAVNAVLETERDKAYSFLSKVLESVADFNKKSEK